MRHHGSPGKAIILNGNLLGVSVSPALVCCRDESSLKARLDGKFVGHQAEASNLGQLIQVCIQSSICAVSDRHR